MQLTENESWVLEFERGMPGSFRITIDVAQCPALGFPEIKSANGSLFVSRQRRGRAKVSVEPSGGPPFTTTTSQKKARIMKKHAWGSSKDTPWTPKKTMAGGALFSFDARTRASLPCSPIKEAEEESPINHADSHTPVGGLA